MAASTILPEITKRIAYNHGDYDCFVTIDGGAEQYIGSASTYSQGETKCDSFVFDYYTDTNTPEKAAALLLGDIEIPTARQLGQRLAAARTLVMA